MVCPARIHTHPRRNDTHVRSFHRKHSIGRRRGRECFSSRAAVEWGAPPSVPTNVPAIGGRSAKYALFIVFVVVVIDLLGFGIVLPLLPIYGDLYVKHFVASNSHWVGAIVGLLMAIFSITQFVFAPIWGAFPIESVDGPSCWSA